tara:strand:- start:206 stop:1243 length:1038 start_codon:yes stop_codon:yes gene_type:complete
MVAFVPVIMVLGRIAVKVGSETVKKYLKKNGFRIAKNYKKYAETVTQKDLPALLKKVKDASGVKPSNVKGSGGSTMTTAGSRGQSALGRRLALSKLKSRGKVGPNTQKAPPMKELPKPKPSTTGKKKPSAGPPTSKPSGAARIGRGTLIGANIMAGLGLAKVGYEAWKDHNNVTDSDVEDIKIKRGEKETKAEFNRRLKELLPEVVPSRPKPAPKVEKPKSDKLDKSSYERSLKKSLREALNPARVKIMDEAEKEALTFVLNKKIKARKSTVAKEQAKARAGEYKTLAEAKKAGSLYYLHKDKELRAAIGFEETKNKRREIADKKAKSLGISISDYHKAFNLKRK